MPKRVVATLLGRDPDRGRVIDPCDVGSGPTQRLACLRRIAHDRRVAARELLQRGGNITVIGCQRGPKPPRRRLAASTQKRHRTPLPATGRRTSVGLSRVGASRCHIRARWPRLVCAAGCPRHRAKRARPVLQADVDLVGVRFGAGARNRRPDRAPEDIAAPRPGVERDDDRDLGVRIVALQPDVIGDPARQPLDTLSDRERPGGGRRC